MPRLELVRVDQTRDLALLRAPGVTTPAFLRFRQAGLVELGEPVSVLSFPLYGGRLFTSLSVTNGIATALQGTSGRTIRFQTNAAMQKGTSGAPVLDEAGLVIGVAVSGLTCKVEREAGGVPQLMNFAVRGEAIQAFMAESGISAETTHAADPIDLREVVSRTREAVHLLLCYRPHVEPRRPPSRRRELRRAAR